MPNCCFLFCPRPRLAHPGVVDQEKSSLLCSLCSLCCVPSPSHTTSFCALAFHQGLHNDKRIFHSLDHSSLTVRDLLHWASLTVEQIRRGIPLSSALHEAMELVYLRHHKSREKQDAIRELFRWHLGRLLLSLSHGEWSLEQQEESIQTEPLEDARTAFLAPCLWPFFVSGEDYRDNSTEATIVRQSALFLHFILQTGGRDLLENSSRTFGADLESAILLLPTVPSEQEMDASSVRLLVSAASSPREKCSLPLPILQRLFGFFYLNPDRPKLSLAEARPFEKDEQASVSRRSDEEIGFAAVYILENSSPLDHHHRICYLRSLGGERGAAWANVAEQLWGHPLVSSIIKARQHLASFSPESAFSDHYKQQLLSSQPLDLRVNAPLLLKLRHGGLARQAEREQAWNHHLNLIHRLDPLLSLLHHRTKEEGDVADDGSTQGASLIRLAYLFHHRKLERSQLPHNVLAILWPFFDRLDQGSSACPPHGLLVQSNLPFPDIQSHLVSPTAIDVSQLESLIIQRNNFWDQLSTKPASALSLADLLLQWKFVSKHLYLHSTRQTSPALEAPSLQPEESANNPCYLEQRCGISFQPSSALLTLAEKIVELLSMELSQGGQSWQPAPFLTEASSRRPTSRVAGRNTLWKRGGHPSLLRSPQLLALEEQLYALLAPFNHQPDPTLWPKQGSEASRFQRASPSRRHWKEGVHPLFLLLDEEFKRVFVESVATLHWLDSSAFSEAAISASLVFQPIAQVPQLLDARLDALHKRWQGEKQTMEVAEAALLEGERHMDAKQRQYPRPHFFFERVGVERAKEKDSICANYLWCVAAYILWDLSCGHCSTISPFVRSLLCLPKLPPFFWSHHPPAAQPPPAAAAAVGQRKKMSTWRRLSRKSESL